MDIEGPSCYNYSVGQGMTLTAPREVGSMQTKLSRFCDHIIEAGWLTAITLTLSRVVESFSAILADEETDWRHIALVTGYLFILASQLICILFSESRGPWMGLMGGLFFFVLLLALVRRWRRVMYGRITAAVMASLFLVLLNLSGTPLEPFKELPYIGRLGRVFETESGTGKARVLIWQGAMRLISPHLPIGYPSGQKDTLNPIQPLVGYGPEAMGGVGQGCGELSSGPGTAARHPPGALSSGPYLFPAGEARGGGAGESDRGSEVA